jgi:Ca-activated chloride channel family protein
MKNVTVNFRLLKQTLVLSFILIPVLFLPVLSEAQEGKVKCKVELERSVLPLEKNQKTILKVSLDALKPDKPSTRPRVNLAIALDRSGSMSGQKLDRAKQAAIEAVTRLDGRDIFSLVAYDDNVNTITPAQSVDSAYEIIEKINKIRSGGSTALFGGVSQAAAEIRKNMSSEFVNRIILLSDGLANVGPRSPADLGRLGAALAKEEISVTTVGVGTDYNEDLMTRLARRSDGNSYFVETARDLPGIFKAELGDVLNVVAKNVELTIICPDGVKPLKTLGRDARIKEREVSLSFNQLYGGQEKYVLLEVEIEKVADGRKQEVAVARATYEDAIERSNRMVVAKAEAKFSNDAAMIKRSVNPDVVKDYEIIQNALSQSAAIELAEKGKTKAAVTKLRTSEKRLRNLGKKYNDEKMLERAEVVGAQAENLEKQGLTKRNRKVMRTDSYQQMRQQSAPQKWSR